MTWESSGSSIPPFPLRISLRKSRRDLPKGFIPPFSFRISLRKSRRDLPKGLGEELSQECFQGSL